MDASEGTFTQVRPEFDERIRGSPMAIVRLPRQPPLICEHRIAAQAAPPTLIKSQSRPMFIGKAAPSLVAMVRLHGQAPVVWVNGEPGETAYLKMAARITRQAAPPTTTFSEIL